MNWIFFSSVILKLTNVTIKQVKFRKIDNLNFLLNHPIKSLSLEDFENTVKLPIFDYIENLELKECNIDNGECLSLSSALNKCKCLKSINLHKSFNIIKIIAFQNAIKNFSSSLIKIDFSYCNLSEENNTYWLSGLLHGCTNLQEIDLSNNDLHGDGFKEICSGMEKSSNSLLKIYLSICDLSEYESCWLGILLKNCTSLEEKDLSFNNSFGKGFKNICNGLKPCSNSLFKIKFSGCDLSKDHSLCLSDLFTSCTLLKEIDLSLNCGFEKSFENISTRLRLSSNSLRKINLEGCDLSEGESLDLGDLLIKCSSLEEINLSWNYRFGKGFERICNGLKSGCRRKRPQEKTSTAEEKTSTREMSTGENVHKRKCPQEKTFTAEDFSYLKPLEIKI